MLTKIVLQNWRSHAKTSIELVAGTNIFLGQMGSGKSSVVDALSFALYGTYPKLGRRDAKLEDVKNFRHAGNECIIEAYWENGGKFMVRRDIGASDAWLYMDAKLICRGAKAVRDEVEQILQIPYELFSHAVYAEQNRLDYWLSLSASSRKSELDSLLGLDKFEAARKNAKAKAAKLKGLAQELQKDCTPQLLEGAKKELEEAQGQIAQKKAQIKLLEERAKEAEEKYEDAKKLHSSILLLQKKYSQAKESQKQMEGALFSLQKNLQKAKGLDTGQIEGQWQDALKAKEQLEARRASSQKEEASLCSQIGILQTQLSQAKVKAKKAAELEAAKSSILGQKSLPSVQNEAQELKGQFLDSSQKLAKLCLQIEDLQNIIRAFGSSSLGAHCPLCESGLEPAKKAQIEKAKKQMLQEAKKEEASLRDRHEKISRSLPELEQKISKILQIDAQLLAIGKIEGISGMQTSFDEKNASLKSLRSQNASLAAEFSKAQSALQGIDSKRSMLLHAKEWEAEAAVLEQKKLAHEQQINSLNFSQEMLELSSKQKESAMAQKEKIAQQISGSLEVLSKLEDICTNAKKRVQEITARQERALQARQESERLEIFVNVVLAAQAQAREQMVGQINLAMQKLWPILYPYGDWQKVRLCATQSDYEVQIFQGEWKSLEAHASGGERASLGLCMRAVLSLLLTPHLGWLILDEPTHNLDETAVRSLGEALSVKMPKIIPQVIVITHEQKLLESAPSRIFKFERDKKLGEDTRVEIAGG